MIPARLRTGELLTSELGTDGLWHARYPTASRTLCMRETAGVQRGRKWPPTCRECGRVARLFDRVDSSMPDHWRLRCGAAGRRGKCRQFVVRGESTCAFHRDQAAAA